MKTTYLIGLFLLALWFCASGGCSDKKSGGAGDADTDTDTDGDGDTDSDGDGDTDSDSDADGDGDGDSDVDTENMDLTDFCTGDGWCWENPTPHGNTLYSVWVGGEDDVWFGGDGGVVYRFDGTDWYEWRSGEITDIVRALWGTGPGNMFALTGNELVRFAGGEASVIMTGWSLNDVHGFATDDIWVAGYQTAHHWNGTTWQEHNLADGSLTAVFGVESGDVWVGGQNGVLQHWDGTDWEDESLDTTAYYVSIWGSATDDVWFVRNGASTLLHWDGSTLEPIDPGLASNWIAITGSASDDVWALGAGGTVAHYDGSFWSDASPTVTVPAWGLWDIHTDGTALPWIVGYYGFFCERLTTGWDCSDTLTYDTILELWGAAGDDVTAMNTTGVVATRDADGWTAAAPGGQMFHNVWQTGDDSAWGYRVDWYTDELEIYRWNGSTWSPTEIHVPGWADDVWMDTDGQGWAVGLGGDACFFDGTSWDCQNTGTTNNLVGVYGIAANDVWAVGENGTVVHWDGTDWTVGASGTTDDLTAVWGGATDDVWAVAAYGDPVHYTGTWAPVAVAGAYILHDVYGFATNDVWAVGQNGDAFHYDGSIWTEVDAATYQSLYAVWGAASDDVWAVGQSGTVVHWDGLEWTEDLTDFDYYTFGVGGTAADDVWVVGDYGSMWHYNGSGWAEASNWLTEDNVSMHEVVGVPGGDIWIVEYEGRVDSYDGESWTRHGFFDEEDAVVTHIADVGTNEAWATLDEGLLLHFDGTDWRLHASQGATRLDRVHALNMNLAWAVGDVLLEWDGTSWSQLADLSAFAADIGFVGLYGESATSVQAVFRDGQVFEWDGDSFGSLITPADYLYLADAHFLGIDDLWAVGQFGTIMHFDGTAIDLQGQLTMAYLSSIYATPDGHVFAGGPYGTLLHKSPD